MHKSEADIRRILQAYGDALYRNAFLLLGNSADVQDALQEVLLRYLEKAPAFSSADHERAWLLHVATNCCMDCLRFRKSTPMQIWPSYRNVWRLPSSNLI